MQEIFKTSSALITRWMMDSSISAPAETPFNQLKEATTDKGVKTEVTGIKYFFTKKQKFFNFLHTLRKCDSTLLFSWYISTNE